MVSPGCRTRGGRWVAVPTRRLESAAHTQEAAVTAPKKSAREHVIAILTGDGGSLAGRILVALGVWCLGAWAVLNVTRGSGRASLPRAGYLSLQMFVLGYGDAPSPEPGEPELALWLALFLAPACTGGAIAGAVLSLVERLDGPRRRARRMQSPVAVVGIGAHGRAIVQAERQANPASQIVGFDRSAPAAGQVDGDTQIPILCGDMTSDCGLDALGTPPRAVWLSSGDALRNLNTAVRLAHKENFSATAVIALVDTADDQGFLMEF